jgi:uncharacterized protein (TIGR02594 family)
LREIPGAPTAPTIRRWLSKLGARWTDDETPWCGVAVAAWMQAAGIKPPAAFYRAKAWLEWGAWCTAPAVGCVVVFEREGGGHVGLVVGKDTAGRLLVLGGNQGDSVKVSPFDPARVASYRWPEFRPVPADAWSLPLVAATGASSRNEA